ncbi:MAG: patatin-like phospholipase family protein, partial [Burkholderiales bacterium]
AGAISKGKWEAFGQKQYLERSLAYYLRGYQAGAAADCGYTGINAAYVLDLLAHLDAEEAKKAGGNLEPVHARRAQATLIREDLASTLTALLAQPDKQKFAHDWWVLVTVAEAYFGLSRYEEARVWLKKAAALPEVPDWERETTARQLASIARLQAGDLPAAAFEDSPAWQVLCDFLGNNAAGVRSAFIGKIGLALSGGGFRASLFHIGVLARLAELDVLRYVEVLSCVSGGAIIGTHYYLEVRKLLQTKRDDQITREDYIALVKRVEHDFLAGVQRNIRMRVLGDPVANLKMMLWPNRYSRTQRVGELYEEEIFSKVDDGNGTKPRYLNELLVTPFGESDDFSPKLYNWRRAAKVPILVLNATTLNTGHNWQFTATWMGEPPAGIDAEVDGNYRLRRMYYREAPAEHRQIRLGHAVAASACVPGLFEPLVLTGLYPHITVRLVDGGVHDNQGVASLLEQGCTVLLVSDASGQMTAQDEPSAGVLGAPLRANSIFQARLREAQYYDLAARRRASLLRGFMFVHLKKDLTVHPIDWIDCEQPEATQFQKTRELRLTRYGIRKDVQERLAAIRTDLDSFSDAEAYALMTSGYRMTEHEFPRCIEGLTEPSGERAQWRFLALEEQMKREGSANLIPLLDVACDQLLKVWKLARPLQVTGWVLGFIVLVSLV